MNFLPVMFALEDITAGAEERRDWETPGGTSPLGEQLFMGLGLGMGVVYTAHTLSVSPKIRKNTGNVLVLGLQGEDSRALQNLLGTTLEQTEKVRVLEQGELVALAPSVWPKPVLVRFEPVEIRRQLKESEREALAEGFLSKVKAVKAVALPVGASESEGGSCAAEDEERRKLSGQKRLSSRHVELLVFFAIGKKQPVTRTYDHLHLHRAEGRRFTKDLEGMWMVVPHTFSTGKRGGRVTIPEVTQAGLEELKGRGIGRPADRTGGGWEHNLAATLIGDAGTQQGMRVRYEVDLGRCRADVEWQDKYGKLTFFNIGISDPEREAENALKILELPVISNNRFVFVARDSAFAKKFKASLKAKDEKGNACSRIEVRLIADFLDT